MSWLILAPASLLFSLLAYVAAPFVVLASVGRSDVPRWLSWFGTPDNAIDGDAGHRARWAGKPIWLRRWAWLWRNAGYGFAYSVCGRQLSGPTHFWGDRAVSNLPMHAGWCWAYNSGAWELYGFVPWWPSAKRGLRVRLGWSIPLTENSCNDRVMIKTHVNPVMGYE